MDPVTQTISATVKAESADAMPSIPGIQLHEGLARFAGDQSRYSHWLRDFVHHGPAAAEQIRQAASNGSPEAAAKLAHALKGRTGMLGMAELYSIAMSLETCLVNSEPSAFWLDELDRAIADISTDIIAVLGHPDD